MPEAQSPTKSRSAFRMVALVMSGLVTVWFVFTTIVVFRYGDRIRDFGWTADGLVVRSVATSGPAAGRLHPGDVIAAFNGDRRVARVGQENFRFFVPPGASYSLTIHRDGVEQTVTLTPQTGPTSAEQKRLAYGMLVNALALLVVFTLIAAYRPELALSRVGYIAALLMTVGFLGIARGDELFSSGRVSVGDFAHELWLPVQGRLPLMFLFWFPPLHLAFAYDFFSRFPPSISTTRPWRVIRVGLYAVCGIISVEGPLLDRLLLLGGPATYIATRSQFAPVDRWFDVAASVNRPFAVLAVLAVLARNYWTVEAPEDRRRIQWVVWATTVSFTPFFLAQLRRLVHELVGVPIGVDVAGTYASLATVILPITLGYAIITHRVFDIRVVIRRGLRYVFAKNALRALLLLPVAGLAYEIIAHRDQTIGELLLTNSAYVWLIGAGGVSLRFRTQTTRWLDRRFFREVYDRERILLALIQDVDQLDSVSSVSKLVSHELEAAFHPQCLLMWYRDADTSRLTSWSSSGEDGCEVELTPESPLVRLAERGEVIELSTATVDALPRAERDWLSGAGARLLVPMIASNRDLLGLLLLGDKKSGESYSSGDVKLLQAIAQQIATAREHVLLKERADDDRRVRHQVLARLESGHVNLLKECPACGACYDAVVATCVTDGAELTLSLPVDRTVDGKYRLDRLIGKGGMGAVYEATDLRLARSVAVKIMLGRAFGDHKALRRFEREAQATARLAHPHIISVFDFGALGAEGAFIVMELVRGRTLRAELQQRGRIAPQDAAIWFEHICAGVAAAHHQGIIHRDLKPENVLITRAATGGDLAKVLDFGLAKIRPSEADETFEPTSAGVVLGTAAYMAPEQLSGDDVDERGDIFALGVMVAEAIVGTRPFRGRTHTELLMAIMRDSFTLDGEGLELRSLEVVLRRAAAKDPSARYRSVTEFADDVIPALRSMSVPRENLHS